MVEHDWRNHEVCRCGEHGCSSSHPDSTVFLRSDRAFWMKSATLANATITRVVRACRENPDTTTPADILRIIFPPVTIRTVTDDLEGKS